MKRTILTTALTLAMMGSALADMAISSKVAKSRLHKGDLYVAFNETNVLPFQMIDMQIEGLATCNSVTEPVGIIFTLLSNSKGVVGNAIYVEGPGCANPTYFDMKLTDTTTGVSMFF